MSNFGAQGRIQQEASLIPFGLYSRLGDKFLGIRVRCMLLCAAAVEGIFLPSSHGSTLGCDRLAGMYEDNELTSRRCISYLHRTLWMLRGGAHWRVQNQRLIVDRLVLAREEQDVSVRNGIEG